MPDPAGNGIPFHAYVVSPGFESALAAELPPLAQRPVVRTPQWPAVLSRPAAALPNLCEPTFPVFARQQLPRAQLIHAPSVRSLAEAAFDAVLGVLEPSDALFSLHATVPHPELYGSLVGRARLVEAAFWETVRDRRRRWLRRRTPSSDVPGFLPGSLLLQLVLVGRGSLIVSVAAPQPLPYGGWDLSPYPAGLAPVAEDKAAPSRAYRKLQEAFAWFGRSPSSGESVVDLGGSPGGWSHVALARGARVTAVDRAPLAQPLLSHPRLTMVLGNALTYRPPAPIDWLLCDVICEPARTAALIERWVQQGLCRSLVATVKFKGHDGYAILRDLPAKLVRAGCAYVRIKHLFFNRNEVEVLAERGK